MAKSTKGHGDSSPSHALDLRVDRVLADGDARDLDVRDLMELIHQVNPSMLKLPPAQIRKRYRQKSQLQSLLIRRFKEDLVVDLDSTEELVGLSHRRLPVDACHAPVDSLDDDARAWVRLQLDMKATYYADVAERPSGPPAPRAPDTSPLGLGRAALEAYDYPLAREHFERALEEHQGSARGAVPLLELLVDTLAADEDALALESRLEARALQHPTVRGLLALAAGRSNQPAHALELSVGSDPHGAQALVLLADAAAAAADDESVASLLGRIEELDPVQPDLVRLRALLAKLRTQAREPLERELTQALEGGDLSRAGQTAQRILARWPESPVARRALLDVAERERAERVAGLLSRATEARGAGENDRALALLHEAQREEPGNPEIDRQEHEVNRRVATARDSAALARVEQLLRDALEDGLTAYGELPAALRGRVGAADSARHRARLDQLDLSDDRARAAARAVLALAEALDLEAQSAEDSRIIGALSGHRELLQPLAEARALYARLEAHEIERRRARQDEALALAEQAVAAQDLARARALLEGPLRDTPRGAALLEKMEAAETRTRRLSTLERSKAEQKPVEARAVLDELIANSSEEAERGPWQAERAHLDQQVRKLYHQRAEALRGDEPEGALARRAEQFQPRDAQAPRVTASGTCINVEAHGPWLFVEEIDVVTQRVVRQLSLRAGFDFGAYTAAIDGRALWVMTPRGQVLEIRLDDWEIRRCASLWDVLPSDASVDGLMVPQGGRYLWVRWSPRDAATVLFETIETDTWRSVRSNAGHKAVLVPAPEESLVAQLGKGTGGSLHAPAGAPSRRLGALSTEWRFCQLAAHPDGKSWVGLVVDRKIDDDTEKENQAWLGFLRAGRAEPTWVRDSGSENLHGFAASSEARAAFAFMDMLWDRLLVGWDAEGAELFRCSVSPQLRLVQDVAARRVLALAPTPNGWTVAPMNRQLPSALVTTEPPGPHGSPLTVGPECGRLDLNPDPNVDVQKFLREEARKPHPDNTINLDALDLVRTFVAAHDAIRENKRPEGVKQWDDLQANHGNAGIVRLYQAPRLVAQRKWDELEVLMGDDLDFLNLRPAEVRHVHHLRGVVRFRKGDFPGAIAAWKEGLTLDVNGECGLANAIRVAESLSGDPSAHPLGAALAEGERRLLAGDLRGAREALDCPAVHSAEELQTFARLADASLRCAPADAAERFRTHKILARYVFLRQLPEAQSVDNLPIPNAWDEARLADVQSSAEGWLAG